MQKIWLMFADLNRKKVWMVCRAGCVRFRLIPTLIVCLGVVILLKSTDLICAALAQNSSVAANTSTILPHTRTRAAAPPSARVINWTDQPPPPSLCKPDLLAETGERKILLGLKQRDSELDARSAALDRQEQVLAAEKSALHREIAALKPLAAQFAAAKTQHRSVDAVRWSGIVATYTAMDPRSAARIFNGLDPETVFNVLRRLNSRKSAAILAVMTPQKARMVTEMMAGLPPGGPVAKAVALTPDDAP
ncbi:MAG TPA: hypothetical protein VF286_08860 [Acidiphilium sp.]